jgi:UDP-2-acetamido-2-deoxy-ribo-hexuluronate aminotransferase
VKNLVFDVNVILDLWLERQPEAQLLLIAALIDCQRSGLARGWIASPSLPVLEYLAIRRFKREGIAPGASKQAVKGLLANLLQQINPLSAFGFQQDEALVAHADLEDAQIVAAASVLQGPTAIVTNDKRFDITGTDLTQLQPTEAPAWLQAPLPQGTLDFIDLKTQQDALRPHLERNLHRVLDHGQYILGPEVRELEARLAAYTGARHCITVASGTEALLISLMALGIGPGDEVITTPFTFVATAEVIVLVGATPVFVDIEPETCNIDARLIAAKISPRTKAILPVSLYGQPADMDTINAIAARHGGIPVIEDAAQSFGATYKGRQSCNLSTLGCTSFFPSKPLGCYGDGGAIFTSDDALAQACREIRVHGQSRLMNSRPTAISAAPTAPRSPSGSPVRS